MSRSKSNLQEGPTSATRASCLSHRPRRISPRCYCRSFCPAPLRRSHDKQRRLRSYRLSCQSTYSDDNEPVVRPFLFPRCAAVSAYPRLTREDTSPPRSTQCERVVWLLGLELHFPVVAALYLDCVRESGCRWRPTRIPFPLLVCVRGGHTHTPIVIPPFPPRLRWCGHTRARWRCQVTQITFGKKAARCGGGGYLGLWKGYRYKALTGGLFRSFEGAGLAASSSNLFLRRQILTPRRLEGDAIKIPHASSSTFHQSTGL